MEELIALLTQRNDTALSSKQVLADVMRLDATIDQQIRELSANAKDVLPVLESKLKGKPAEVYAAAFASLRIKGEDTTDLIVRALLGPSEPEQLSAICRALCDSSIENVPLELLLDAASTDVASAILLALAAHGKTIDRPLQIEEFMVSESAETRARAWQIVALLGSEHTGAGHAV